MDLNQLLAKHGEQLTTRASFRRTLCEVLREMWEIIGVMKEEDLRDEMRARLLVSYDMAKRMSYRLREYKHGWDEGFWEMNKDRDRDLARRIKKAGELPSIGESSQRNDDE